jgi:hypothetical protein
MKTKGNMRKEIVLLVMAMLLVLSLAGCGNQPAEPGTPQDNGEGVVIEPDPNTKEIECDWQIEINDEIPWQMGTSKFNVKFQFSAQKKGGIDPKGEWNGKAVMILEGDASVVLQSSEVAGTVNGMGKDDNVSFVLDDCSVPVKVEPPPNFPAIAPLTKPDYYTAGQYLNFEAAKDVDILFPDNIHFQDAQAFTGKRYMHLRVEGLTVTAQIEGVGNFKGTCEGIPVGN